METNNNKKQQLSIFTPLVSKRVEASISIRENRGEIDKAAFMHSVLCQTFLPYRDPKDVREYYQRQGNAVLLLKAGELMNPKTQEFHKVGLPYGAKARLVLAHINTMAIKTQNPVVSVEDSLTAFVKRLGLDTGGKTIKSVKEQVMRLAGSTLRIGYMTEENKARTAKLDIIDDMEVWLAKDDRQRVLWSGVIKLSDKFFNSLCEHSIPLDERALASLANNAFALDIYCWLAQRLHRVRHDKPQFITWGALKEQFGSNYKTMKKFREKFRATLKLVQYIYPDAKLEDVGIRGILLKNSPPPISYRSLYPVK